MLAMRREALLAVGSLVVALVSLEGAFRLRAALTERADFDAALRAARAPAPGARVTLGGMIRPSDNRRIVYELWPDMEVVFDTGSGLRNGVRTSPDGFRSRSIAVEKPRGLVRIAGIGDSLMFGWGVEQDAPYLSVLERRLRREHPGSAWEVLNTAVPGYNAVMEVETLKAKVLKYRPDVVVYGFCSNDASLPNFVHPAPDPLSPNESFLWTFVRRRVSPERGSGDALVRAPRRPDDRAFEDDPSRVPPSYREITGWEAYRRALEELRELGRQHGFRTIVLAFAPGTEDPRKERGLKVATELGFTVVDVGKAEAEYMTSHGIAEYGGSPLTVGTLDLHPSPLSHEIAAEALAEAIAGD